MASDPVTLWTTGIVEADDVFLLALETAADLAVREWTSIEEKPRFLALVNEFGGDAVLTALRDVQQIRLETIEKVFGKVRRKPPPSGEGSPP